MAAVEARPLALAQRLGGAAMVAVAEPRPVVGGEHHQRVVIEPVLLQGVEDLAHRPVDLLDHVAVEPALGFAAKLVAHVERDVGHIRHDIEEDGWSLCRSMKLTACSAYQMVSCSWSACVRRRGWRFVLVDG